MEYIWHTLLVLALGSVAVADLSVRGSGPRCHQCTGVTDPHFCSMIVNCNPDEECHTEKVLGEGSIMFYNSGCQSKQLCALAARGRRSELHVCEGCCGTDLCNSELCPVTNSTTPGVQCYQCDEVDAPGDCSNRVTCADGEQCIVQKYATDDLNIHYSLGCETKQRCTLLESFGKRSTQICNQCCDTPGCNRHLCIQDGATTTQPSDCQDDPEVDCKIADDAHNICADRTLAAVRYCRKFCGYCTDGTGTTVPPPTGSTEDPCKDSGDVDCQQLNDTLHMCEKSTSPAVLLYCPKFCGICTPQPTSLDACADNPEVDCAMANTTEDICTTHSLTATKYCREFCGYCNTDGSPVTTSVTPTGTTLDPCRDSGDIDCRKMNATLQICNKPDSPPTIMYCPKYCGLCEPVCADAPDVDCLQANDTQNICALGTLAAKNYCRKFCGYCGDADVTTVAPPAGTTSDPCKDSGDVDCKNLDDTLGICNRPDDPPTQLYCPKYCGLCH